MTKTIRNYKSAIRNCGQNWELIHLGVKVAKLSQAAMQALKSLYYQDFRKIFLF